MFKVISQCHIREINFVHSSLEYLIPTFSFALRVSMTIKKNWLIDSIKPISQTVATGKNILKVFRIPYTVPYIVYERVPYISETICIGEQLSLAVETLVYFMRLISFYPSLKKSECL